MPPGASHPISWLRARRPNFSVCLAAVLLLDDSGIANLGFWQPYVNPLISTVIRERFAIGELICQWYWYGVGAGADLISPIKPFILPAPSIVVLGSVEMFHECPIGGILVYTDNASTMKADCQPPTVSVPFHQRGVYAGWFPIV